MDDEVPQPSGLVTLAGFALAFAGITLCASALQVIVLFDWYALWITVVVYVELALGLGAIYTGFSYTRASGWTADAGFYFAAGTAVFGVVRVGLMIYAGLFTAVSLFAVVLACGAAGLVAFTRVEVMRIHAARMKLLASLRDDGS